MTDEDPLPIPHRCGAIVAHCVLREGYNVLFCDVCKKVVGFEIDGFRYMRTYQEKKFQKKEYSEDTLNDSV